MDLTDKTAQPSMEEILASIRKLLSEESAPAQQEIDFNARPIMLADDEDDEAAAFDLPAIFRSSAATAERPRERSGASLGRLTDAIRSVTGGAFDAEPQSSKGSDAHAGAASGLSSLKLEDKAFAERALEFVGAAPVAAGHAFGDDVSFFEEGAQAPVPGGSEHAPSAHSPFAPVQASPGQVAPAPAAAQPASGGPAMASNSPGDVQRVMAPFKDTKFKALSSPSETHVAQVETRAVVPAPEPARTQPHRGAPDIKREPVLPSYPPRGEVKQGLAASFPQAALAHREEVAPAQGIEEAAADLLRPMLRSWLAENMPKMVEKALVLEMNQQLAAIKKSGN